MVIAPLFRIRDVVWFIIPTIAITWYGSAFVVEVDWMNLGLGVAICYGKEKIGS